MSAGIELSGDASEAIMTTLLHYLVSNLWFCCYSKCSYVIGEFYRMSPKGHVIGEFVKNISVFPQSVDDGISWTTGASKQGMLLESWRHANSILSLMLSNKVSRSGKHGDRTSSTCHNGLGLAARRGRLISSCRSRTTCIDVGVNVRFLTISSKTSIF